MCLITNKQVKIAQEDIEIFKVLSKDFKSPFLNFQYELDKSYFQPLSKTKDSYSTCCSIDHDYIVRNYGTHYYEKVDEGILTVYQEGFHGSLKLKNCEHLSSQEKQIFKCIIPKGSEYVEDFVGFIISNQIIIKEQFIMTTLLLPSADLAQIVLDDYFRANRQTTTLELKNKLREVYPDHNWTQLWVSSFLLSQGLEFDDNGVYRVYYAPMTMTLDIAFELALSALLTNKEDITKKSLKREISKEGLVYGQDYDHDEFESVFAKSDLQPSGSWNKENHIIYVEITPGNHLSKSTGQIIPIKTMHKNHVANALLKYHSDANMSECLDPNTKVYELLEAYFTYDVKQKLNNLIN